ncbi:hypothetical protein GCM10028808_64360 [Spirosoma migulaei]
MDNRIGCEAPFLGLYMVTWSITYIINRYIDLLKIAYSFASITYLLNSVEFIPQNREALP